MGLVAPTTAYTTWAILSPPDRWRAATCEEVDCEWHRDGWVTRVPIGGEEEHLVKASGRRWTGRHVGPDGVVEYMFPPGTRCFRASTHRVHVDREDVYLRLGGHHQQYTGDRLVHSGPQPWLDEFGENQERLSDAVKREGV